VITEICTIGGYGHTFLTFFDQLQMHGVNVLVDIRQRRGLRGSSYAFLNATALQNELQCRGIGYIHLKELAPTTAIRDAQKAADQRASTSKRDRTKLSEVFESKYKREVLGNSDKREILAQLVPHQKVCFFCVEGPASACHRSLVSEWLSSELDIPVTDIGVKG
jgi:uncharacterized protein (DUF488 family)